MPFVMEKPSELTFVLHGLNDTRTNKQIYFVFSLFSYLLTILVNLTLIVAIFVEKALHEPMYLFVCNMCINGLYGASGFYPRFLIDLLSDTNVISYVACITQVFVLYSYIFCEFTNLTVMAYDRYVAICKPLQYHSIMTQRKVGLFLQITWLLPICEALIGMFLTVRLPLCGSSIEKLYCFNWEVVKLSCTDTTANNLYGYALVLLHFSQVMLIVVSYVHIVQASLKSRTEQARFMETCLPHLITLINFLLSLVFDVMYARYGTSNNLHTLRNMFAVEYLVIPPLINPIIYGVKLSQIRKSIRRMCSRRTGMLK